MKQNSANLANTPTTVERLKQLHEKLQGCRLCKTVQGRAVHIGQAQTEGLPVQVVLQRLVASGQVRGINITVVGTAFTRLGVATPFAVVRR